MEKKNNQLWIYLVWVKEESRTHVQGVSWNDSLSLVIKALEPFPPGRGRTRKRLWKETVEGSRWGRGTCSIRVDSCIQL
jgi:hypothetical protein